MKNHIYNGMRDKLYIVLWVQFPGMNDPKYASPSPAQGYYQGPPVMAPPQYAAPPTRSQSTSRFIEGCFAALCFCCVLDGCCCDPSICF